MAQDESIDGQVDLRWAFMDIVGHSLHPLGPAALLPLVLLAVINGLC